MRKMIKTNDEIIFDLRKLGFEHYMENGDHVVEGYNRVWRHTSLLCICFRVGEYIRTSTDRSGIEL